MMLSVGSSGWATWLFVLILISGVCISSVSGYMVSSPDVVKPGSPFSVYIGDLKEDDEVEINIIGSLKANAGSPFSFVIRDLNLGFDLDEPVINGSISDLTNNTEINLSVYRYTSLVDPLFTVPPPYQVVDGVCDFTAESGISIPKNVDFTIMMDGHANRTQIPIDLSFTGNVFNVVGGINTASLAMSGFSNGIFIVNTSVNGTHIETKQFTVQDQFLAL